MQKYAIINNMIITYGGVMQFCLVVLETFRQFPVELQNIDNLARTARMIWNNKDKYIDLWGYTDISNCNRICDFYVTYFDEEDSVMKHATLIYDNDYEPTIFRGEPHHQLSVSGFEKEKAHNHLVETAIIDQSISHWLLNGYNAVSCENVGGLMTLMHIVKGKIESIELFPIIDSKDVLYADTVSPAKHAFLQEIGGQNILTYIDQKTSSYKVSYSDNAEVDSTTGEAEPNIKLSGNYIEGRGLKTYDSNNNLRVHIDGESGAFHMYNGYIEMLDSNGNALYMNPQEFITWVIDGEKKFYYDQTNNALVFGGTIDTLEDVKVGETIVVRDSNGGDGLVISAKGGMTGDSITITANSGRYIDIKTSLARLNGERILTTVDKTEIEDSIESLKTWVRENFAPKVTTNPITPLG